MLLSLCLRPLCLMSLCLMSLSSLPETFSLGSLRCPLFAAFFCLFPTLVCIERHSIEVRERHSIEEKERHSIEERESHSIEERERHSIEERDAQYRSTRIEALALFSGAWKLVAKSFSEQVTGRRQTFEIRLEIRFIALVSFVA
jgi:hypothetical protein